MVIVNNFEVLSKDKVAISVETQEGKFIEKIHLWSMYDFKDYSKMVDVSDRILGINNKEALIIPASEIGLDVSKELLFLEVVSNEDGCDSAMAVTYDTGVFQQCLLDYLFKEFNIDNIDEGCCGSNKSKDITFMISIMLESIDKSLSLGLYGQAIDMIDKVKKICGSTNCGCSSSEVINTCSTFKQF